MLNTKTSVLRFIKKNGMINPELIREHISNKRSDLRKILGFCEELFTNNKILKTGPHTFTLKRRNYEVKRILKEAEKNGRRLRLTGYALGTKRKYNDPVFIDKVLSKNVLYKNITKDGFKNRRVNTILTAKYIK